MNKRAMSLATAATLLLSGAATVAQDNGNTFGFGALLSGAQEVVPPDAPTTPSPGVATQTTGAALVAVASDLSSFDFRLVVQNGVAVTASHLHCGRAGENGPIIVFLSEPNVQGAEVNGVLGEGTVRSEDIEAGAAACEELIGRPVRNIASLAAAAAEGLIYANVHTVANPAGEIRGQLIPGLTTSSTAP
ncbi:MAG TPA: CHRD domain-containing protein [Steroidobacteraceae bacterium]|nr:CHRD domain-containing protein [Steroidobacteraceae bacterium]